MVEKRGDEVTFTFYRPDAGAVYLAGDFNGWRVDQLGMTPDGRGYWTLTLRLPAGRWRFRYHADGKWFTDLAAAGLEFGRFGADSIVEIAEPAHADSGAGADDTHDATAAAAS
jgi:1,4-alpha-glucan branching enzyme